MANSIVTENPENFNNQPAQQPAGKHDPIAEQDLLGALLIAPEKIPTIDLDPSEFYIHAHRWIFQAMVNLYREGSNVDITIVADRLDKLGKLQEIGGLAKLTGLVNDPTSWMHAQDYARIIRENAMVRKLTDTVTRTMAKVTIHYDGDLAGLIQEHVDEVQSLLQNRLLFAEPWQVYTLADAYQERLPAEYVVGKLFEMPSLNLVYGSAGSLKSMLLADLAVCVAAGVDWLPPASWITGNHARTWKTQQVPVMWLDFDQGRRRSHERFEALARTRNLPADAPFFYYSLPDPWLDSREKKAMTDLATRIKDKGVKLVVTDHLTTVSGDADENSAEIGWVLDQWRKLAEDTNACVIMIHHPRKGGGFIGEAGDDIRGHSSIKDHLDLGLFVKREEFSDTITITAKKVRGVDVLPFSAAFTYTDDENDELETAQFFGVAAEDNQSGLAIEREIRVALLNTTMNKTDLVKAAQAALKNDQGKSPGINRIRDRIDRMTAEKKFKISVGKNNTERMYSLP